MSETGETVEVAPRSGEVLESAEAVYGAWREAMARRDVDAVVALYHERDAGFWGTLAEEWQQGRPAIRPYFEGFLNRSSLAVEPLEAVFRELEPGLSIAGGSYRFTLGGPAESDEAVTVLARFTFVFRCDEGTGGWSIIEHHSSKMPSA